MGRERKRREAWKGDGKGEGRGMREKGREGKKVGTPTFWMKVTPLISLQ